MYIYKNVSNYTFHVDGKKYRPGEKWQSDKLYSDLIQGGEIKLICIIKQEKVRTLVDWPPK